MSTHDEARRAFLIGAVVGAGTAAGIVPDAVAQGNAQEKIPADATARPRASSIGDQRGAFFNPDDAQTVAAFAERLMPGATKLGTSAFASAIIENMKGVATAR